MYEVYYNLQAEPFRLSPDHKFCYEHKAYAKARAYMAYAFRRAEGFVMITGRPGTGKTTLIGELVESLSADDVATANLVCTQLEADDLLRTVAYNFGIGSGTAEKAELLQRLTVLLNRWYREERRALLIVDEAQDLSLSAMEELRLLTNIQVGGQPLLQIFLLGQPELRDLVLSPEMEQVHQRVVAASHLQGLELDETEAYVLHRLQVVGWRGDPAINRAIFPLIFKFSEGVPRRINLICSRLFLLGSVEDRHTIDVADMRVVISELQAESLAAGSWFTEEDFLQSDEPDWVIVPSREEAEPEWPEVQLRAVNSEPLSGEADAQFSGPVDAEREAKKKAKPSIAIIPALDTPAEITGNETPAQPLVPEPTPESSNDSSLEELEAESPPPPAGSVTAPGGVNRRPVTPVGPRLNWRRILAVGTIFILMLALVFFLEIFVSRQDAWVSQTPETVIPGISEKPFDTTATRAAPLESLRATQLTSASPSGPADNDEAQRQLVEPAELDTAVEVPPYEGEAYADEVEGEVFEDSTVAATSGPENGLSKFREDTLATAQVPTPDVEPFISEQKLRITFPFDSVELLPDARTVLNGVVEALLEQPSRSAAITGFADSQGEEFYNLHLSRMRAVAVQKYLIEAGVERSRLRVEGKGALAESADPSLSTTHPEKNRIVLITIADEQLP